MSPSKIICGYLWWGPIQVKPLHLSRLVLMRVVLVILFSIARMKKQGLWDVVMWPYASCKSKNGIKFRRNAWIGLVRGLVFTCFVVSTTCIVHPPSFFAEGKRAWTCTFKPLHYGTETFSLLVIKTLSKAFVCNPSERDARLDSYFLILV